MPPNKARLCPAQLRSGERCPGLPRHGMQRSLEMPRSGFQTQPGEAGCIIRTGEVSSTSVPSRPADCCRSPRAMVSLCMAGDQANKNHAPTTKNTVIWRIPLVASSGMVRRSATLIAAGTLACACGLPRISTGEPLHREDRHLIPNLRTNALSLESVLVCRAG